MLFKIVADGGWEHGEWELGKRMVTEEESGEEVAVREVIILNSSKYIGISVNFD